MGIPDELDAAVGRSMDAVGRKGGLATVDGREALRTTIDLMLQRARHLLEVGDPDRAREVAQDAIGLLEPLNAAAVAMSGLPGLRLDASQIIGTVLLHNGERAAAIEELRRAASHVYAAQPDERAVSVACPPLERQLAQLWRELAPSPAAHRVRASLRAVRMMLGYLEEAINVETGALRGVPSAHEKRFDGPFFDAASRLVERPLPLGADAPARLERARGAMESATHDHDAAQVALWKLELAEALDRLGRRTEAVATVEPLLDVAADLPDATLIELCFRASTVALHGLRPDVGIRFGRVALEVALRPSSDGSSGAGAAEGIARFTLGRALSEGDEDEAALIECERAHHHLSRFSESDDTAVRVAVAYAASYVAFLREHTGDRGGAMEALASAQAVATRLASEHPEDRAVLGVVLEVAMATARRRSHEDTAYFGAAIDLLETAIARDPEDLAIAADLYNALRFFALTLLGTRPEDAAEAQRRSLEVLESILAADPGGLNVTFHRAELAQEQALQAHFEGRQTTFRWQAQDSMKLHAAQVSINPMLPASTARAATTAMQLARVAAAGRDRKFARRLVEDGLRSARRQVELQPDVRTAHEILVTRIREASRIAAMTGDGGRERELMSEALEATRRLVALDPEDPELQYALADALMEAVAVIGQGRMKGVDGLFAELDGLAAGIATADPLHPRLRRTVFSVAEASALRADSENRSDHAFRHVMLALQNAYGGIHIRHHHAGAEHSDAQDQHRIAVLASLLDDALDAATGITTEEREQAFALRIQLHRSGFGSDPQSARSSEGALSGIPRPDDDIPEVIAPRPDRIAAVGEVYVGGAERGALKDCLYIKPSNGGHPDLHFGVGLAATKDLIVVGAPGDPSAEHHVLVDGDASDRSGTRRGAVHVYRRSPDGWHQEAYLKPPAPINGLEFGWSVAVDGGRIAVGSPSATYPGEGEDLLPGESGPRLGGIWLFTHGDAGWELEDMLIAEGEALVDGLGANLVLEGDTLLASGIDAENDHGVVVEFVRTAGGWSQRSVIRSPRPWISGGEAGAFGRSLAMDGDVLVVGEPNFVGQLRAPSSDPTEDLLSGAAWVFRRGSQADWRAEAVLLGPAPRLGSAHGTSVDVRGDLIAVTAALHPNRPDDEDPGHKRAGAVVLYGRSATGWEALATLSPPHPHSQEFGASVAISDGRQVLIGVPLDAHGADWGEAPDVTGPHGPRYGAIHIVEESPDGWRFSGVVAAEHPGTGDEFGSRITLSGIDLVVAAPNDGTSGSGVGAVLHDDDARESGAVHVFRGLMG